MKQLFLTFIGLLLGFSSTLTALDSPQYPASEIPETLLKNANAVVRTLSADYKIIDDEHYEAKIVEATTVINENGTEHAFFSESRNKFRKISDLTGYLYDAKGKRIRAIKESEFEESMLNPDYAASDEYHIQASPIYNIFPYTIVYHYKVANKNPLWYPTFKPQPTSNVSVQNAQFTITITEQNSFRYKTVNSKQAPQKTKDKDGKTVFTWTFEHLPATDPEPFSDVFDRFPYIITAPDKFTFEKYQGDFTSWDDFGLFYYQLNANRLDLPPNTIEDIKKLVANTTSSSEKIQLIYNYMQDKTRYISIQLGIGGWQCFSAKDVNQNGYGDCKALSNYTQALLKAADIEAYSALIYGGEINPPVFPDFVSNRFNHVILCVPNRADTIWLECTNQTIPFNYLSDFTDNRYALLVKPSGGELVRTPAPADDQTISTITVQLPAEGNTLSIDNHIVCTGETAYNLTNASRFYDKKEQQQWVQRQINPNDSRIETFALAPPEHRNTLKGSFNVKTTLSRGLTRTGNRLFITPGIFSTMPDIPIALAERKLPVYLRHPFNTIDSIKIVVPAPYAIEALPNNVKIESVFGTYTITYKKNGQYLQAICSLQVNATKQTPDTYPDLRQFLADIRKANNKQISLIKP